MLHRIQNLGTSFSTCTATWCCHSRQSLAYLLIVQTARWFQQHSKVAAQVAQALGLGVQVLAGSLLEQHVNPLPHK